MHDEKKKNKNKKHFPLDVFRLNHNLMFSMKTSCHCYYLPSVQNNWIELKLYPKVYKVHKKNRQIES